ncbi:MAG: PEP-CTERM sorting domain-containing protein [Pseudomonadota bacterium]
MKRYAFSMLTAGLLVLLLFPVGKSHAIQILYEATNLADTTPGEDLWQYEYAVSDYSFDVDYGLTIYFDYSLYSNLVDPPPYVNDDWDPIVWQPDNGIPDDGAYDALALESGASLADPFAVSFVWLGSGVPGSQFFEVYDPYFNTIESGDTAPVPEPATILLVGSGLLGLAGLGKRVKKPVA